jgi:hypothetical protein
LVLLNDFFSKRIAKKTKQFLGKAPNPTKKNHFFNSKDSSLIRVFEAN